MFYERCGTELFRFENACWNGFRTYVVCGIARLSGSKKFGLLKRHVAGVSCCRFIWAKKMNESSCFLRLLETGCFCYLSEGSVSHVQGNSRFRASVPQRTLQTQAPSCKHARVYGERVSLKRGKVVFDSLKISSS